MKKFIYVCALAITGCTAGMNTPWTKQQPDPAPPATGWVAYPYSASPASGPVMVNQVGTVTPTAPTPSAPVPSAPQPTAPNPSSPIGPAAGQNPEVKNIVDQAQVPVQHVTPASEVVPASQPKAPVATSTEAAQQQSKPPPQPAAATTPAPKQEAPNTYNHKYVGPQYDYQLIEKQAEEQEKVDQPKTSKHYAHEHTQTRRRYSKHSTSVESKATLPNAPEAHTNIPATTNPSPSTDPHVTGGQVRVESPEAASEINAIKANMFKK